MNAEGQIRFPWPSLRETSSLAKDAKNAKNGRKQTWDRGGAEDAENGWEKTAETTARMAGGFPRSVSVVLLRLCVLCVSAVQTSAATCHFARRKCTKE